MGVQEKGELERRLEKLEERNKKMEERNQQERRELERRLENMEERNQQLEGYLEKLVGQMKHLEELEGTWNEQLLEHWDDSEILGISF